MLSRLVPFGLCLCKDLPAGVPDNLLHCVMAEAGICDPNPVILPEHASMRRRFRNSDKVDPRQLGWFDTRTLFYDIHFDIAGSRLTGVGPGLLNLRSLLRSMSVHVDGQMLKWKASSIKGLTFFKSEPLAGTAEFRLSVEFRFKEFSAVFRLPKSVSGVDGAGADCPLTISTLQKDNELVWITDWLKWHHRAHGVGRLVLYDNGSGNRTTKSCQLGSLNHCRMRFAIRGGYCINNDVDEYLHLSQGDLLGYLKRKLGSPAPGAVMYQSVTIPNIAASGSRPPRVLDFRFASVNRRGGDSKLLRRHFQNPKYIL